MIDFVLCCAMGVAVGSLVLWLAALPGPAGEGPGPLG